jgi:hypothetical protein
MIKFLSDFLFGLAFGMGFAIAWAVLRFIGGFLASAQHPIIN